MENFLGQIQAFGFNFAPQGWATCDGQLLNIQQNTALFSLLGVAFGGNGTQTFGLPDLRGRAMLHQGQGPGRSAYTMGQAGGVENATLSQSNLPSHTHSLMALNGGSTVSTPSGNVLATSSGTDADQNPIPVTVYAPVGTMTPMAPASIGSTGNGAAFSILSPFQTVNVCIALQGIYPSRP